jgi:hypothetical protein
LAQPLAYIRLIKVLNITEIMTPLRLILLAVSRQPVLRSLLLGLLIAGPAHWLLRAGMQGFYQEHLAGEPFFG